MPFQTAQEISSYCTVIMILAHDISWGQGHQEKIAQIFGVCNIFSADSTENRSILTAVCSGYY